MLDEPLAPMLATRFDPFDSGRHLFEIKWDGARCVLFLRR
jgi:ATP-dependent DNA ligase